jgi:TonB-linked SusC/RagA family outer membrane protein
MNAFLLSRRAKKLLLTMKLTFLMMVIGLLQVSATVYSQSTKFSFKAENKRIVEVLKEIEETSNFRFFYQNEQVNVERRVTLKVNNATVEEILDDVFKGQGIGYKVMEDFLILLTPEKQTLEKFGNRAAEPQQQQKVVTGKVTDTLKQPLPGVSVVVKGTKLGTVTNFDGEFSFSIPSDAKTLVFSFVGMKPKEVEIAGQRSFVVSLEEENVGLEEVVVVGYGTMKKSDLTGSVTSVKSKDFIKGIATNVLQLVSGKVSGVNISQSNSEPGGMLSIRVRGAGSINSSNNVLVVIDGLPGGDPASLNPTDIESVDILKDASSAAIYGTRAANGVVLITTKKGSEGIPQVSYNSYMAFQTPSYKFDVLNATEYMQMINDISKDGDKTIPFTDSEIAAAGKGTDWQNELLRNAWAHNHQVALKGGHSLLKYYISLGYLNQDGILLSSGFKKYNLLMNLEITPSKLFKFGINLNGNLNLKDKIANESNTGNENADPLNAAIQFDPRLSPKKKDGKYEINPSIALDNPIAITYGYNDRQRGNVMSGSTYGEFEIINGLEITGRLGASINNNRNDSYKDRTTQKGKSSGGIGSIASSINNYWIVEGFINYDKTFNKHHISFMGGATMEKFDYMYQYSYASGFLSDVTGTNFLSSGTKDTYNVSSTKITHALQSFTSRANYSLQDKYLLTATIRCDGTSRFSEDNKFAFFPSIALGWRLSEELFMKELSAVSNLKLRLGYGQMGNEGISDFETIQTFVSGGNALLGGVEQSGAQPARIPNTDLKWETTEELNYGLDFGFFDNRITGNVEYYVKNTYDQLFNRPVPMSTGFVNVRTNFGNVRNSGFDFSLTSQNLTGKMKWKTCFTISTLKNKVIELPPYSGDIITGGIVSNIPGFALVREGYPMRAFYGYKVTGIFQVGDNIAGSAQPNAKAGEPIFLDNDNNGKINSEDRIILGKPFPDVTYSINNLFSYKNFNFEIYLLGVQGVETFNGNVLESMMPINFDRNIMSEHYFGRWTSENSDAKYPSGVNSAVYFGGGKMINNYTVQDASFLRLKNVTLSYNFPLNNFKVFKSVQLSLSGENLLTFTKFEGFDPEGNQNGSTSVEKSSYNNYPLAKVYRIGANINF